MNRAARVIAPCVVAGFFALAPVVALAWDGTKTITSLSGTLASPGTMTGNITIGNIPTAGSAVTIVDAFQAVPDTGGNANRFYQGTYMFTFTNCLNGTAANVTETIGTGGAYPGGPPPANTNAPIFQLGSGQTSMSCDYSVKFVGTAPAGTNTGLKNDVWLPDGAVFQATAPNAPAGVVPDAPLPVLIPLVGLTAVAGRLVTRRRRAVSASRQVA
jgi:hypothetical protein